MKIDVKITSLSPGNGATKAHASVNLDDAIAIRNIRVMEGKKGLFASMPSYQGSDKKYYDIVFPLNAKLREELNNAIVDAYLQTLTQLQGQSGANFNRSEQSYEAAP
ncbi:MAG: SpoVG family protein, partial [Ruminococcaceae bacterium]|nr:SpoVG family protein [Oscillospiraceae bacterium]